MPNFIPIPMIPAYVSTDMEADLVLHFKICALIKFTKTPEIINLLFAILFKQSK